MSIYYIAGYPISDELYHHGIKGQRWGIRRYQNQDGSVTAAGALRYYDDPHNARQHFNFRQKAVLASVKAARALNAASEIKKNLSGLSNLTRKHEIEDNQKVGIKSQVDKTKSNNNGKKLKKAAKIGAAVVGTALVAYGTYKLVDHMGTESYRSYLQRGSQTVDKQIELHKMDLERNIKDVLKQNGKRIKYR